jgi:hypothetical protein
MTPATIIETAAAEGVVLTLLPSGAIKAAGDQVAVARWLPIIREQKSGIVEMLREADNDPVKPTPADGRMNKMTDRLRDDPGPRYAIEAHDDVDPAAVILTLVIRGKAACELRIPKSHYDAFVLLDLIKRHTTRETLQ